MKIVVPDYYDQFACLMGNCRHSCCIGWEIDIDAQSLEQYQSMPGEMGDKLRANILRDGENACFRLGEGERCPFLNREGLCELILACGDGILCQICADHPRYRNFWSDRVEIGLGLCCEAAGKLVLGKKEAVKYLAVEDDGCCEEPDTDEAEILDIRSELTAIVQNRNESISERIVHMKKMVQMETLAFDLKSWAHFLMELERMDDAWANQLNQLTPAGGGKSLTGEWDTPFEQLMVYLLNRHLQGALDDDDLSGRIAFVLLMWSVIRALFAVNNNELTMDLLVEICRMYSSEIEYSDENIGAIIDKLHEVYPEL